MNHKDKVSLFELYRILSDNNKSIHLKLLFVVTNIIYKVPIDAFRAIHFLNYMI